MAAEEPEVRVNIQLGNNFAFAVIAASFRNVNDAIHHQHVANGESRIARAEQFAVSAGQQLVSIECTLSGHVGIPDSCRQKSVSLASGVRLSREMP